MKLLFLVLDGAADRPNERGETPLSMAKKPNLDSLAVQGALGLHYPLGVGKAPESDAAVLSILGYDPDKYYTGRGPLEALGVGYRVKEGYEVAFRANFATINPESRIILDRRVGRSLESWEAQELAKAVDGIELGGGLGYARVMATIGHRAVVIIGVKSGRLSGDVTNNDPAYVRVGKVSVAVPNPDNKLAQIRPLNPQDEASSLTARLANEFVDKVISILKDHPLNKERARKGLLQANVILMRDAGDSLPKVTPINQLYGLKFGAVAEMPVERGIARALGMDIEEVKLYNAPKDEVLSERFEATMRLLERVDVAYVHLKGPDEPGHDGDLKGKVKAIEDIDEYYVARLIKGNWDGSILVTSDHATPWSLKAHSDDPVPIMLKSSRVKADGLTFNEVNASKGSLGRFEYGWLIMSRVKGLVF
ncbi:alkaline phosphatase family protein [Caldivirga maquilingensis]|uniref:Phosphonopyruvate decarboxylase-related protein n=1 Tax=Caldivirga maquilingensis (strain ATCC 700844 / DSM 13496 / JCM 10307 / IC-167) TaxID=397948 RepID=A8MB96_CALMQ|nr:alkaline phosphatase family protein [Caldivirga maquilingensis]ABW01186.1 phosphonopyruvate decarboxylase-related protein [Caldivirga maquilingensis IC-167]